MEKYKIKNLTSTTSQAEQDKLIKAIKEIRGVKNATLQLDSSQISVEPREKQAVKRAEVTSAASRAGFEVTSN